MVIMSQRILQNLRTYIAGLNGIGLVTAVAFFCLSLTPSLIPRIWLYQAVISGICLAIGYGLGTAAHAIARAWGLKRPGSTATWRILNRVIFGAAVVAVIGFSIAGASWQEQLRQIFRIEGQGANKYLGVTLVAVGIGIGLIGLSRAIRRLTRWLNQKLQRWVTPLVARLAASALVIVLCIFTLNGVIIENTLHLIRSASEAADHRTDDGATQPNQPERSGSPASNVSWESLRNQGRNFVSGGPSLSQLQAFNTSIGRTTPAREPIRAYAGLDEVDLDELRDPVGAERVLRGIAREVVAELERTNAWDREVLVVATTTGTGWVDPAAADTLEYLHGGNSAIAAMQYSFMPSWVSFVSDRDTPLIAGQVLFEEVYEAWSQQPEAARPRLIAFGISLGAYGSNGAFASLQDVTQRTDGALWVGPPNFTSLWSGLTARRDAGSSQASPVYDGGRVVRWGTNFDPTSNLWDEGQTWQQPRVVYLQHPSDAVTWWSFDLILNRPDWLAEPREQGVLPQMQWIPFVTFWQVTMDMFAAGSVPAGNGHMYVLEYSDGWAAVAPPADWDADKTEVLRAEIQDRFGLEPELTPGSPGFVN